MRGADAVPHDFRRRPFETPREAQEGRALRRAGLCAQPLLGEGVQRALLGEGPPRPARERWSTGTATSTRSTRSSAGTGSTAAAASCSSSARCRSTRREAGLTALLSETAAAGQGSFLAVLKRLGAQQSRFSFPMAGYTLALDFPANARTLALLDRLDAITRRPWRAVLPRQGRAACRPPTLHRADPVRATFRDMRREAGLDRAFASAQSERLLL